MADLAAVVATPRICLFLAFMGAAEAFGGPFLAPHAHPSLKPAFSSIPLQTTRAPFQGRRDGSLRGRVSGNQGSRGVVSLLGLEFAQPEMATYPQQVFTAVNFVVLPFWGLMIAAPKWEPTQNLMKGSVTILLVAAMHLSLVAYGLSQPGSMEEFQFLATQGFVKLSAMQEMRQYPTFVSEEWAHVLGWDLFVGRFIYIDGLKRNVPTPHSLFFCFLLGPVGLTMHLLTRAAVLNDAATILELDD